MDIRTQMQSVNIFGVYICHAFHHTSKGRKKISQFTRVEWKFWKFDVKDQTVLNGAVALQSSVPET